MSELLDAFISDHLGRKLFFFYRSFLCFHAPFQLFPGTTVTLDHLHSIILNDSFSVFTTFTSCTLHKVHFFLVTLISHVSERSLSLRYELHTKYFPHQNLQDTSLWSHLTLTWVVFWQITGQECQWFFSSMRGYLNSIVSDNLYILILCIGLHSMV